MNSHKAHELFEDALRYSEQHHAVTVSWAKNLNPPETFRRMSFEEFVRKYCWVVYVSGFRASTIEKHFESLTKAYKDFDVQKLVNIKSPTEALEIINNSRKADGFLRGVRQIHEEGYSQFQKRVLKDWKKTLQELPYIGQTTVRHLARDIGVADIPKDDLWLKKVAESFEAPSVDVLVDSLSEEFKLSKGTIDVVIWLFCANAGWRDFGFDSFGTFVNSLG